MGINLLSEDLVLGPEDIKLETKDLNFFYGDFQGLKNINLQIANKAVTAFIGPSGCGKSTLLRTFNRIYNIYPDQRAEGEILLDKVNILDPDYDLVDLRTKVGMVFQRPSPFPMSVFDNIAFGVKQHEKLSKDELEARVEESLTKAALWNDVKDKLHKNGASLSGGQQQRLCIARAIAVRPDVLLMDEPCSALDPISTSTVEDLILELKNDYTVLIVTHSMQQAMRVSDNTVFMYLGEVIEYNTTDKIFMNPKEQKTADYVTGRFG